MSGIRLKYLLLPDLLSKSQLQDLKTRAKAPHSPHWGGLAPLR